MLSFKNVYANSFIFVQLIWLSLNSSAGIVLSGTGQSMSKYYTQYKTSLVTFDEGI